MRLPLPLHQQRGKGSGIHSCLSLTSCVSAMSSHFTYMLLVLFLHFLYVFAACLASLVAGGSPWPVMAFAAAVACMIHITLLFYAHMTFSVTVCIVVSTGRHHYRKHHYHHHHYFLHNVHFFMVNIFISYFHCKGTMKWRCGKKKIPKWQ